MPNLLERIEAGKLRSETINTHHMALEDAATVRGIFEKAEDVPSELVLTPSGPCIGLRASGRSSAHGCIERVDARIDA